MAAPIICRGQAIGILYRSIFQKCGKTAGFLANINKKISSEYHLHVADVDALYKQILVEVKGHDFQVMQSYRRFVYQAAKELDVNLVSCEVPEKHIERKSLLRSVFIYKKHWTQYEMRTHFMIFAFKHLTGSTADTVLEYIQRNLPEGMAMKVTKHKLEKIPEQLQTLDTEKQDT